MFSGVNNVIRFLAFIMCRIFFKHIHISGTPYGNGGAIWAANHSSAIVDPAVLIGLAPVKLRPLAKLSLWQNLVMRFFLVLTKSIPVSRLQDMKIDVEAQLKMTDHGSLDSDWRKKINSKAFEQVSKALLRHENILTFPEGVSHDDPFLYPFKTGLARMALQALSESQDPYFSVIVQPVVIDYSEKSEFRSELNIHYCEPIAVTMNDHSIDVIMKRVHESMQDGFANFCNWSEKRNWRFLFETVFGRCPESSKEFKLFVEKYSKGFEIDSPLMSRIQTTRRFLDVIGISPIQLAWGKLNHKKNNFALVLLFHGLFYMFITVPVETLGVIVWLAPAKLCDILAKKSTLDRDVRATMKLAHGIWIFPLWAFILSFIFTIAAKDYLPNINGFILWFSFLVLTPAFFAASLVTEESADRFFDFLRLAKLRLFFPRGWREFVQEWKSVTDQIFKKMEQIDKEKR
jgi:1-acyl-sn-glycerol-3-phosphate acyltransferase